MDGYGKVKMQRALLKLPVHASFSNNSQRTGLQFTWAAKTNSKRAHTDRARAQYGSTSFFYKDVRIIFTQSFQAAVVWYKLPLRFLLQEPTRRSLMGCAPSSDRVYTTCYSMSLLWNRTSYPVIIVKIKPSSSRYPFTPSVGTHMHMQHTLIAAADLVWCQQNEI